VSCSLLKGLVGAGGWGPLLLQLLLLVQALHQSYQQQMLMEQVLQLVAAAVRVQNWHMLAAAAAKAALGVPA
jgi:hypothetical protein